MARLFCVYKVLKINPNYIVAVLTFYFALRAGYCH